MKLTYNIPKEEWLEGYDLHQKLFNRKSVYIRLAMFAVPLLLFIQQVWLDPYYTMGWFCIGICLLAMAAIVMTKKLDRRNTERALEGIKDDIYTLDISDNRLSISTILPENDESLEKDENGSAIPLPEIAPTVIDLTEKKVKVIETEKIIGVFSRDYSAVIPKSPLSVYELEDLRKALKINA